MALEDLLDFIRQEHDTFPAAQRLVAAYVVENYLKIPFLSITTLAKNIGVSENTVVKFCNHLGYAKFTEFKKVFSEYAHAELILSNRLLESDSGALSDDAFACELEESMASIRATLTDPFNQKNLPQLLTMMHKAKHIYITGGRASGAIATFFANLLRYLHFRVYAITLGVGDYLDQLAMADADDLIIAISFPRYTAQVVDGIRDMHEAGVPIVLITDPGLSPAYPYADLVFQCYIDSDAYFPRYSGCLALIGAITRAASVTLRSGDAEYARRLEARLLERGIFL